MPSRLLGAESLGQLVLQGLVDFLKGLGASRLMAMIAVTAALIGFFAFVIMRVTTPQMTTLFTDLSLEDSSSIIKDLDRQGIPYEMRNDGAVIMVPKDKVTRLRMKLAESGLPKGGGVGYEIFDKSDALGTTSFVQNINHLRALEGELSRTIRAVDRIQAARVHLVLPERPLFSREAPEPSASIVVRVRGTLEPQQVRAIRHLVASAVSGLKPQRVSIVDESGQLLADGAASDADQAVGDERHAAFEKRMRKQVEDIVSSVVGQGRARVELAAVDGHTLAHAHQAVPTPVRDRISTVRPSAVVAHLDLDMVGVVANAHFGVARGRVFDRVRQPLLHEPVSG